MTDEELAEFNSSIPRLYPGNEVLRGAVILTDEQYEKEHGKGSVVRLGKACKSEFLEQRWVTQTLKDWKKDITVLIAQKEGEGLGYITLARGKGNNTKKGRYDSISFITEWITIDAVCVMNEHRRKSVGDLLLKAALRITRNKNYSHVAIQLSGGRTKNVAAFGSYTKAGFKEDPALEGFFVQYNENTGGYIKIKNDSEHNTLMSLDLTVESIPIPYEPVQQVKERLHSDESLKRREQELMKRIEKDEKELRSLKDQLDGAHGTIGSLRKRVEQDEQAMREKEETIQSLKEKIHGYEEELRSLRDRIQVLEEGTHRHKQSGEDLTARLSEAEKKNRALQKEVDDYKYQVENLTAMNAHLLHSSHPPARERTPTAEEGGKEEEAKKDDSESESEEEEEPDEVQNPQDWPVQGKFYMPPNAIVRARIQDPILADIKRMQRMEKSEAVKRCKEVGCPLCGDSEAIHAIVANLETKGGKKASSSGKSAAGAWKSRYNENDKVSLCNACYATLYGGTASTAQRRWTFEEYTFYTSVANRRWYVQSIKARQRALS